MLTVQQLFEQSMNFSIDDWLNKIAKFYPPARIESDVRVHVCAPLASVQTGDVCTINFEP